MIKKINSFDLRGKKVILRTDYNLPLSKEGEILSFYRAERALKTINYLIEKGARIIIISHLGRPQEIKNKKEREKLSLRPLADFLHRKTEKKVIFSPQVIGKKVESLSRKIKEGEILLLENIRFWPEEERGDERFAKELSKLGDIYISEAFSVSHRNHASITLLPKYLPHGIGFLFAEEIENLGKVFSGEKPITFVVGGAKVKTKISFLSKILPKIDYLLLGGKIGEEVLKAKSILIGRPLPSPEVIEICKKIDLTDPKIYLPLDVIASPTPEGDIYTRISPLGEVKKEENIFDVGPETVDVFSRLINESKTIVLLGPLGLFENELFAQGTKKIVQAIGRNKERSFTVAGGGETILFLEKNNYLDKFDFVSTGGGATLAFLSGEELPGIKALEE